MDQVDFVLVGSEAVVESGGLINAVGSNQMAIIAKAAHKPFYALAERYLFAKLCPFGHLISLGSYKFHRLFPLSQYDLPTHTPNILSIPSLPAQSITAHGALSGASPGMSSPETQENPPAEKGDATTAQRTMTAEQIARNPDVDYTRYAIRPLGTFHLFDWPCQIQPRFDLPGVFRRRDIDP